MFIYMVDKNVGSINSLILMMIISRRSNFLQDVNIIAWLSFLRKKYEVRQGSLRLIRNSGVNFRISQIIDLLMKLRKRDEIRKLNMLS